MGLEWGSEEGPGFLASLGALPAQTQKPGSMVSFRRSVNLHELHTRVRGYLPACIFPQGVPNFHQILGELSNPQKVLNHCLRKPDSLGLSGAEERGCVLAWGGAVKAWRSDGSRSEKNVCGRARQPRTR